MAEVRPLRALRYAPEKVGDLSLVVTPPYDVISPQAQIGYYERSPYNVIRLELGQEEPGDGAEEVAELPAILELLVLDLGRIGGMDRGRPDRADRREEQKSGEESRTRSRVHALAL